jgi:hypothetical protein
MSLPVSPDYLAKALHDECWVQDLNLAHHRIGDLLLPTGELVACDPYEFSDGKPFSRSFPRGVFPVILSIARTIGDQRVAFAIVKFRDVPPVTWEMLTHGDQELSKLERGHVLGYSVDAATGCFMDRSAEQALDDLMAKEDMLYFEPETAAPEQETFFDTLTAEMDKNYQPTWGWLNRSFGDTNLIAFSSGYGDGLYVTYAGFGSAGEVSVVVTDFSVIPSENNA